MQVSRGRSRWPWGERLIRRGLLASSVLSLLATALIPWGGSAAAAAEPVVLRVVSVTDPGENEIRQEIARMFEKLHPNIKVQLLPVSDRVTEQLVRVAGGDPPDVLYLNPGFFQSFARQGILLDLTPYVRRDGLDMSRLYSSFVQQLQSDGKLYAMPFEVTSIAMLYNQSLFDEVGLPLLPTKWNDDRWTWKTLVEHGRKLTRDKNGDGKIDQWAIGLVLGALDQITYPFVFQNGGGIFDDKANRFLLNSKASVEALQWIADLINKEKIARAPIWGGDLFLNEQVAMFPFGRWLKQFQPAKFTWNAAPLPKQRQAATMLVWLAYGIAASSPHKEEAWEFLKFLISPEVQVLNTARGQALSALPQLEEQPIFQNAPPRGHYQVFAGGIAYAQPVPYADDDAKVSGEIWNALYPVWTGRRSAQEAMDSIAPKVESLLKASTKGSVSPTRK